MSYGTKEIFRDISLEKDYIKATIKLFIWFATWLGTLLFSTNDAFSFGFTSLVLVISMAVEFVPKVKKCITKCGAVFWGIFILLFLLGVIFSFLLIALKSDVYHIFLKIIAISIMVLLFISVVFSYILTFVQTADQTLKEEGQNDEEADGTAKLMFERRLIKGSLGSINHNEEDAKKHKEESYDD